MHLLNKAYDELRSRLVDAENKSKYDVLVQAKEYIQALAKICQNFDKQNMNNSNNTVAKLEKVQPKESRVEITTSTDDHQLNLGGQMLPKAEIIEEDKCFNCPLSLCSPSSNSTISTDGGHLTPGCHSTGSPDFYPNSSSPVSGYFTHHTQQATIPTEKSRRFAINANQQIMLYSTASTLSMIKQEVNWYNLVTRM